MSLINQCWLLYFHLGNISFRSQNIQNSTYAFNAFYSEQWLFRLTRSIRFVQLILVQELMRIYYYSNLKIQLSMPHFRFDIKQ